VVCFVLVFLGHVLCWVIGKKLILKKKFLNLILSKFKDSTFEEKDLTYGRSLGEKKEKGIEEIRELKVVEALPGHSLSRVILLIAAVDALVTAVLVVEIVLAAAGATGATRRMMRRRELRRDHRRKRRSGRYSAMRRQSWDRWIA